MNKKKNICLICLRTDIELKNIDHKLSEFHDELCDFNVPVDIINPKYCLKCEYLLRKLYNFKNKCVMAMEILSKWKNSKAIKKEPLAFLCTLLPKSVLTICSSNSQNIFTFTHQDESDSAVLNLVQSSDNYTTGLQSHVFVVPVEKIDSSQDLSAIGNVQEIVNPLSVTGIKVEYEDDDQKDVNLQNLNLKTEESVFFEIEEPLIENLKVDNNFENHSDDSSDDEILCLLKDNKNKIKLKPKKERSHSSDGWYSDEDSKEHKSVKVKDENVKRKRKVSKKVDKDNKKKRRVTKNGKDICKKERFHTKRDIIAELVNETNSNVLNEDNTSLKKGKPTFTKEKLKLKLIKKFAACGELVVDDTIIDKEFILNSLDDKVTDFVMKQLWAALVLGKTSIKPKAQKLLKCIQNKYKNECGTIFDVEYLNTKEKMMEEFQKRKTYECYVTAEFKCEICYQGFKHEKKLEYHMKCNHDENAGEHICPICSVRHRTKKNFVSHVNSHEAVYKCRLCPLVTYYKSSMLNHSQWHKGVKYRCEECDKNFGSRSAFRTHQSYRHPRGHVCTTCARAFYTRTGLKWHITRVHQRQASPPPPGAALRCAQCPLSFPSADVFRAHVRTTHEPALRGRRPGTSYNYSPRKSSGKPRRKPVMTCRVCSAVGHSAGWLGLHFRTEHPSHDMAAVYADKKTHLCHVCGKGFTTLYTLQAHLPTHSGSRAHACSSCGARFARALSLRAHRLLHAPPARVCPHCGKRFRSQSNLANHIRFHTGDRRYKCKICGKGFLHRGTLNEHVRGVHHNVRRVRRRGGAVGGAAVVGLEGGTGVALEGAA